MRRGGILAVVTGLLLGGAMVAGHGKADEPAGPRAAAWQRVQAALDGQRPRDAAAALAGIEAAALAAGAWDEVARAIASRVVAETGDRPPDDPQRLIGLAAALDEAPPATRGVLEAIQANWTWGYFLANRWRFAERTAGGAAGGLETLAEWDLPRIVGEIRGRFARALGEPGSPARQALQGQPVAAWSMLLPPAALPDAYRPTLFDVVAADALAFHALGERGLVEPEDAFTIDADGPALGDVAGFRAWRPAATTTDALAPALAAAELHRDLLDFHAADADRTAFLAADLERIGWAAQLAVGGDVAARHRAALERFIAAAGDHEIGALARFQLAELLQASDPAAAHAVALVGATQHPDAPGGRYCQQVITAIEAPILQLVTERTWAEPWPVLRVTHRHVPRIHLRICRADWKNRLAAGRVHANWIDEEEQARILALPPVRERTVDLPATADHRQHHEDLPVGPLAAGLEAGAWWVIASPRPGPPGDDNPVSMTLVWVTRLALVTEQSRPVFVARGGAAPPLPLAGHVVDVATGEPVAGAEVIPFMRGPDGRQPGFRAARGTVTDAEGRFQIPGAPGREVVVTAAATIDGVRHEIASDPLQVWPAGQAEELATIVLITDRGIHRPGQTVFYKGIAGAGDHARGDYRALARERVTVVLRDANGREIATAEHTTSPTGSFDGTFALPAGGLPGQWSITATAGAAQGGVGVRVEEYKRPKFRVALGPPEGRVALGGEVVITGTATSYTGLPVAGAKVAWRVERLVRWPEWCRWVVPGLPGGGSAQRIARGSATTDEVGRFTLRFPALPDRAVPATALPVFRFRTTAVVTDAGGETHDDQRTVSAGYTDLEATVTTDGWQAAEAGGTARVALTVATTSLDGNPQSATGRLTVVRLVQPAAVPRGGLGADPEPLAEGAGPNGAGVGGPGLDAVAARWPAGEELFAAAVTTDAAGRAVVEAALPPGIHRATFTIPAQGDRPAVTAVRLVEVLSPEARTYGVRLALALHCDHDSVEPGETFRALVGTGHDSGRALVEIAQAGRTLTRFWTAPGRTQWPVTLAVDGSHRGGFTVRAWLVRDGRLTTVERSIDVPWSDKKLSLAWERFTRRLEPGAREVWRARVSGAVPAGAPREETAELLAILSDQSLEALAPHAWPADGLRGLFRREGGLPAPGFSNGVIGLADVGGRFVVPEVEVPSLDARELRHPFGRPRFLGGGGRLGMMRATGMALGVEARMADAAPARGGPLGKAQAAALPPGAPPAGGDGGDRSGGSGAGATSPPPRRRLVETAFFLPALATAPDGTVTIEFTLPDTLTTWQFCGLAHDARLASGTLLDTCVAAKDLMVEPLVPRFVREGDVVELPVKVGNRSTGRLAGTVRLGLADARSGTDRGTLVGGPREQPFDVAAGESATVVFTLRVAEGTDLLEYTATATAGRAADGEQGLLPVLPRRVPAIDSIPVTIRGPGSRTVTLERLAAGPAAGVQSEALFVEGTANPAWVAVLALPVLIEEPDEGTEALFGRLYANSLAAHLAASDPRIERVFAQWRGTAALESPLEKNTEVVRTLLEETPWVREARDEAQARARIGLLFERTRTGAEAAAALDRLGALRNPDGGWPWFPGGPTCDPVTLSIIAGFGRLRAAGVPIDIQPALATLPWLDGRLIEEQRRAMPLGDKGMITPIGAFALYARSFFAADAPPAGEAAAAVAWGLDVAARTWMQLDTRLPQAHLAIALDRAGRRDVARTLVDSLRQRAVGADVPAGQEGEAWQGMWWRDPHPGWWGWTHDPIATQAVLIEAFDEVAGDAAAVAAMQVWLLSQKRVSRWPGSRATADAVGALLGRGADLLAATAPLTVSVGGVAVDPGGTEAGTGFFRTRFVRGEITPARATVGFTATGPGLAWGGVHWQYLAPIDDVVAAGRDELAIDKQLFVRRFTKAGPVLDALGGAVEPGAELVVRLVVTTDRDHEFLELADHRPSLTEPVDVLSGWRAADGALWYLAIRDTSTRLFFQRLPRGTHVFEYALRAAHRGRASSGFATIHSRHAPEFSARSRSLPVEVR
ncbi:MAG: hypothetical protein EBR86_01120 [Planctomycetia bacterium]|nr:hypothetical protein [Planctomycetia bacterium]